MKRIQVGFKNGVVVIILGFSLQGHLYRAIGFIVPRDVTNLRRRLWRL